MALLRSILEAGQRVGLTLHRPSVIFALSKFHSSSHAVSKTAWGSIDGVEAHKFVLKVIHTRYMQNAFVMWNRATL